MVALGTEPTYLPSLPSLRVFVAASCSGLGWAVGRAGGREVKHCLRLRLLALESSHVARPGNHKGDVNIRHFDLHGKEL